MGPKQVTKTLAGACLAALAVMVAAQPLLAEGMAVPGTDGRWVLVRDDDLSLCVVVAQGSSEAQIGFLAVGELLGLTFYDEAWNLPKGATYTVSLRFDGKRSYATQMEASTESLMVAKLYDIGVRELSHSSTVAIYNESGTLVDSYSLRGSRLALDYVRKCGRIVASLRNPSRSNPFAQQPASRANPFD